MVLEADGKHVLRRNNFLGLCWQHSSGWWTGQIVVFGTWYYFDWPSLEVAAYDLHRHWEDSSTVGVIAAVTAGTATWEPATWFNGRFPRCIKQKTGRPSNDGACRMGPTGNVLSLQMKWGPARLPVRSPWHVFWNGKRVVANPGFEWFKLEEAQDAAEEFDRGNVTAYRLR
jgi:hypothetical protein